MLNHQVILEDNLQQHKKYVIFWLEHKSILIWNK
jgi:hypothetical protein